MNKKLLTFTIGALLLTFPALVLAQSRTQAEPRGTAGFISHTEGEVFLQDSERAELEMVVTQGDELMTRKGRVEVDLGRGNWLRLDEHTRVSLTSLQKNSIKLSVEQGSVYLHLESKTAEVRTPAETFHPENGLSRVDVEKNKAKIYANPRVVDRFDSWNSRLEEGLYRPEDEQYYGDYGYGGYGGYGGWRHSFGMGWGPYSNWWSPYSYWYSPSWSYFGYMAWPSFYYPYLYGYGRNGYGYGRSIVHRSRLQKPVFGRSYNSRYSRGSYSRGTSRSSFSRPSSRSVHRH
jgi:hypothetical protein